MVNSSQGNTAFGAYISLTGRMIQAVVIGTGGKTLNQRGQNRRLDAGTSVGIRAKLKYFIFAIVPTAVYEPSKPTP
jgi:hypothetical protein